MLSLFAPGYIKEAQLVSKNARKLLHYRRDALSEATVADFESQLKKLDAAISARDQRAIEEAQQQLDVIASNHMPPPKDAGWRENCEVFLVAIVIAIGVRTYFLQPFTIPTGSMQPTLNGIIGVPTAEVTAPNFLRQAWEFITLGRNYIDLVAKTDDRVEELRERKFLYFFSFTDIRCLRNSYTIYSPLETLRHTFHVDVGTEYRAGDVIARGYIEAGDHVFVDKASYNFRLPHRGEVFVFKTTDIRGIENNLRAQQIEGSQFYIKRLAGLPGDELRIEPPRLFTNGAMAREFGFQRVMSQENGYRGYANGPLILNSPESTFQIPPHSYFAMGDNSYNSFDSRYWGTVPERNVMGRGVFVYWPFNRHWGFVK